MQGMKIPASLVWAVMCLSITACDQADDERQSEPTKEATPATAAPAESVPENPTKNAYFGNLHVHTSWSFDGYINGAWTTPDDAYRWAKGEEVAGDPVHSIPLKIKVPLDWYIVSDHAEYLGALPLMEDASSPVSEHPLAEDITGGDAAKSFAAYGTISEGMYSDPPNVDPILGDPELAR